MQQCNTTIQDTKYNNTIQEIPQVECIQLEMAAGAKGR